MIFKLFSFLLVYGFIISLLYFPQQEYIHSHCTTMKGQSNQQSISCIACSDMMKGNQRGHIKDGIIRIYLPNYYQTQSKSNDDQNKTLFQINVYEQHQCFEYQCTQLQLNKEQQNNAKTFGFEKIEITKQDNPQFIECKDNYWSFYSPSKSIYQNNKCIQLNQGFNNVNNNLNVCSFMVNFTFNSLQSANSEPPSFYLFYSEFQLENALLFLLIGAITLSQSQIFFKHAYHEKLGFLGNRKNVIYLLLGLSMVHFVLLWKNVIFGGLMNGLWIYLFLSAVLESQKANKTCTRIFSMFVSLFWVYICVSEWQYGKGVILGYGIMLSLMQYCFISALNLPSRAIILLFLCLISVIGSVYLLYRSQFQQVSMMIAKNIPFLQFMLLISLYQEEKKLERREIFPVHGDMEDIELKISRQLGQ